MIKKFNTLLAISLLVSGTVQAAQCEVSDRLTVLIRIDGVTLGLAKNLSPISDGWRVNDVVFLYPAYLLDWVRYNQRSPAILEKHDIELVQFNSADDSSRAFYLEESLVELIGAELTTIRIPDPVAAPADPSDSLTSEAETTPEPTYLPCLKMDSLIFTLTH